MKPFSMFDEHAPPWNVGRAALFTESHISQPNNLAKICYAWSIRECENREKYMTWNFGRFITFFRYFVFTILNNILWSSMATMQFICPSLEAVNETGNCFRRKHSNVSISFVCMFDAGNWLLHVIWFMLGK